jgi:hypothetical protein
MNISTQEDERTARTCVECAAQRAENLAILGAKKVLELCVGPSLQALELAYQKVGIKVAGNDIDPRWKSYYPKGEWYIGDARKIDTNGFDAVVVAPPLSRGCSGKREDSLSLEEVTPSFYDFLDLPVGIAVYVLPGRTLSLKEDREQLHRWLSKVQGKVELVPLRKKVVKYLDVYVVR